MGRIRGDGGAKPASKKLKTTVCLSICLSIDHICPTDSLIGAFFALTHQSKCLTSFPHCSCSPSCDYGCLVCDLVTSIRSGWVYFWWMNIDNHDGFRLLIPGGTFSTRRRFGRRRNILVARLLIRNFIITCTWEGNQSCKYSKSSCHACCCMSLQIMIYSLIGSECLNP